MANSKATEDSRIKCQVTITFSDLTEEQREHLHKAEEHLALAGITFDRGGFVGCNSTRDWEFDWSLSKNVSVYLNSTNQDN